MTAQLKHHIKGISGVILGKLFPNRRKLVERYATIPWHYKPGFGKLELLIRAGLLYAKSNSSSEQNGLMDLHKHFWKNQLAGEYYSNTKNRFNEIFIPYFSIYLRKLDQLIQTNNIESVVEIGTGDGQLLAHLAQRWPSTACIGLDLSYDQIEHNKNIYRQKNIEFHSGDAIDWIKNQTAQTTLYITGLGVLEYFEYTKLSEILNSIKNKHTGNMLFLTEPVYNNINMDAEFDSFSGGYEHSFTHAYPKILERGGWKIIENDLVEALDNRFWVGIAINSN